MAEPATEVFERPLFGLGIPVPEEPAKKGKNWRKKHGVYLKVTVFQFKGGERKPVATTRIYLKERGYHNIDVEWTGSLVMPSPMTEDSEYKKYMWVD